MAVGWGALVAGIALVVVADSPGPIKLAVAIGLFALAGFLAGVRAEDRRIAHALFGALAGMGFYVLFVLVTMAIDVLGGPRHAGFIPAGRKDWIWHVPAFVVAALVGGTVAALRLRPQGDQRSRRRGG